ncbi:MAG TPA: aminotransferase class V-fold PLP-dependent enzyme [Aggregatilineales bacterium]|nr:aminotransferase class V-fold PLP-dependent enzyme [Aggregatilineales bacterium]
MRDQFLIHPDVVFLNHGSFGACPLPVFEVYQGWQRELEAQPVEFMGRRADKLLDEARVALGEFLHCHPDDVVYVPNATVGMNTIARSIPLKAGDEILATDHEYGAVDLLWEFIVEKTGATYIRQPMPLPFTTPEAFIERLWSAVTPRTRVISISHLTSPTALIFPLEEIIRRARKAGIYPVIDGAHAPGQLPLNLTELDPDFYTGNCHKWMCAPKGAGFLYVRRELQDMIDPLIISWGYQPSTGKMLGGGLVLSSATTRLVQQNQYQATRDISAYLSVPAAIDFQKQHNWDAERERCHQLAVETRQRIADLTEMHIVAPEEWLGQMFISPLPDTIDPNAFKQRLYDEFKVEAPIVVWNNQPFIRISFQGYNTQADADAVVNALTVMLG